jgi:hypothetical protein
MNKMFLTVGEILMLCARIWNNLLKQLSMCVTTCCNKCEGKIMLSFWFSESMRSLDYGYSGY